MHISHIRASAFSKVRIRWQDVHLLSPLIVYATRVVILLTTHGDPYPPPLRSSRDRVPTFFGKLARISHSLPKTVAPALRAFARPSIVGSRAACEKCRLAGHSRWPTSLLHR